MPTQFACGCRVLMVDYQTWIRQAAMHERAGEKQLFCRVCERWCWPDEVGPRAKPLTEWVWSIRRRRQERKAAQETPP
jgi:hypothetical protein